MRLGGLRESGNVEDRRGMSFGRGGVAVGGGCGTLIVIILALIFGVDPGQLLSGGGPAEGPAPASRPGGAPGAPQDDEGSRFVRKVLGTTEDVWNDIFRQNGSDYREPTLVLFSDQVRSACGAAGASVGPFYCPGDEKVYIDLAFFRELGSRFRAPGDFAQAYVIAHEVGHHVQNILGTSGKVTNLQRRAGRSQANQLSVRLELQADCYAGVWGFYAKQQGILDPGDLEEALRAASAIGDDRLQREAQGYAVPDSFTHGSSEQRARWFRAGFDTGDVRRCDTFSARSL